MKLSSFQGNNCLVITQSNHGSSQNNCAFDFGWQGTDKLSKNIYAPCDGTVYVDVATAGGDNYFNFSSPDNGEGKNFYIQFVHDKSLGKRFYKKGELLGYSVKDHHHVSINVNRAWHWIFDYIDRGTELFWWTYGNKDSKWALWSTYPTDLQLYPLQIPPVESCETKLATASSEISRLNGEILRLNAELNSYHLIEKKLYEKS